MGAILPILPAAPAAELTERYTQYTSNHDPDDQEPNHHRPSFNTYGVAVVGLSPWSWTGSY